MLWALVPAASSNATTLPAAKFMVFVDRIPYQVKVVGVRLA